MRVARLVVVTSKSLRARITGQRHFVRLVARNGRTLMHGELVDKGDRAKQDALDAMIDVLRSEGYKVTPTTRTERSGW